MAERPNNLFLVSAGTPAHSDFEHDPGLRANEETHAVLRQSAAHVLGVMATENLKAITLISSPARRAAESADVLREVFVHERRGALRRRTRVQQGIAPILGESSALGMGRKRSGHDNGLMRLAEVLNFEIGLADLHAHPERRAFVAVTHEPVILSLSQFHGVVPDLRPGGVTMMRLKTTQL
jgi:hypothetical protein